jgi:hypothetical protein
MQIIEALGGLVTITASVVSVLMWGMKFYKKQIQSELRREFRHEIDRIVTEQNHAFCFLENHLAGYERLQISGEYRSIFYQGCDNDL